LRIPATAKVAGLAAAKQTCTHTCTHTWFRTCRRHLMCEFGAKSGCLVQILPKIRLPVQISREIRLPGSDIAKHVRRNDTGMATRPSKPSPALATTSAPWNAAGHCTGQCHDNAWRKGSTLVASKSANRGTHFDFHDVSHCQNTTRCECLHARSILKLLAKSGRGLRPQRYDGSCAPIAHTIVGSHPLFWT